MSLSGIKRVSSTSTIFIDVQNKGSVKVNFNSSSFINVENSLSNPTSGNVNLGFDFVSIKDSSYATGNNKLFFKTSSDYLEVISSNTEYNISLDLDSKEFPSIVTLYTNKGINENIAFDVNVIWTWVINY
mgnify:CR=1 FL=1